MLQQEKKLKKKGPRKKKYGKRLEKVHLGKGGQGRSFAPKNEMEKILEGGCKGKDPSIRKKSESVHSLENMKVRTWQKKNRIHGSNLAKSKDGEKNIANERKPLGKKEPREKRGGLGGGKPRTSNGVQG